MKERINIVLKDGYMPEKATKGSSGYDLCSTADYEIRPGQRCTVLTGVFLAIPEGLEAQIRTRSGMARKHGIVVANSPGTIDSDYRGEVGVILLNTSQFDYHVNKGDKVAQMVFARVANTVLIEVEDLDDTERGDGGFGSTGR